MTSSAANRAGTFGPSERSAEMKSDLEKEVEIHDLHDEVTEPAKVEIDEEDAFDLISEAYYLLGLVAEARLSKRLHSDVLDLRSRLEAVISWSKLH